MYLEHVPTKRNFIATQSITIKNKYNKIIGTHVTLFSIQHP